MPQRRTPPMSMEGLIVKAQHHERIADEPSTVISRLLRQGDTEAAAFVVRSCHSHRVKAMEARGQAGARWVNP